MNTECNKVNKPHKHAETGSPHWYAIRDLEHYVVRNQDLLITDLERALRDDD